MKFQVLTDNVGAIRWLYSLLNVVINGQVVTEINSDLNQFGRIFEITTTSSEEILNRYALRFDSPTLNREFPFTRNEMRAEVEQRQQQPEPEKPKPDAKEKSTFLRKFDLDLGETK